MTDLLTIFLVAALLENLVLARYFDQVVDSARKPPYATAALALLLVLVLAALTWLPSVSHSIPAQARAYLATLAFVTCAISVAQCDSNAMRLRTAARDYRLRLLLPLAVANVAVVLLALIDQRRAHSVSETAVFCLAATLSFQAIAVLYPALRDRIETSNVPRSLRGLPITILTAGLVSLAAMGLPGLWP